MFHPRHVPVIGRSFPVAVICGGLCLSVTGQLSAQPTVRNAQTSPAEEPLQVIIEREPLLLKSPETYRVSLDLKPVQTVKLAAPTDGIVDNILIKGGEQARQQAEIIRLDSRERQLELERAQTVLQAAQIEQQAATQGTEQELADARLQIAKIELELAEYRLDRTIIRSPFEGTAERVHVMKGQFVRSGEPLATLVDTSQLIVEIPIDRATSTPGAQIDIRIEGKVTSATLQQVLPLTEPFEPLRELFQSIATGVVVVDNGAGEWHAGQTVYAALIPRSPVTEVPNRAISNTDDGGRRVQIVRDGFIRDVPIELLGAVGEERTIVTGRFGPRDELIVRSSEELLDGTQVVPRSELVEQPATSSPARRTPRRPIPPISQ